MAIFQFLVCLPLAVPAALAGNPAVSPLALPRNLWDGWLCYLGYNSVTMGEHPDRCWPGGPLYVSLYLVANINFNILIIMVGGETGDVDGGVTRCMAAVLTSSVVLRGLKKICSAVGSICGGFTPVRCYGSVVVHLRFCGRRCTNSATTFLCAVGLLSCAVSRQYGRRCFLESTQATRAMEVASISINQNDFALR